MNVRGTNLYNPLLYVSNIITNDKICNPHIILATDGQPEQKNEVIKLILDKFTFEYSMFVIGAGSIRESIGNQTRTSVKGLVHPRDNILLLAVEDLSRQNLIDMTLHDLMDLKIIENLKNDMNQQLFEQLFKPNIRNDLSNAECDIKYLEQITYSAKVLGCYAGAFGDYAILDKTIDEWIDFHGKKYTSKKYKVILNDGSTSPYTDEINNILDLDVNNSVLFQNKYGLYLVTKKWQLAVKFTNNDDSDNFVNPTAYSWNHNLSNETYEKLYNEKLDGSVQIILNNIGPLNILCDANGYPRIRKVIYQ